MIIAPRALDIIIDFSNQVRRDNGINMVIMPVNICREVYDCYLLNNFEIKFIDINNYFDTDILGAELILKSGGDKIFLYNHTYGNEFTPYNEFKRLKSKYKDLIIIDDKCLCEPLIINQDPSNYADLTVYSTGPKKQCDLGYGGFGFLDKKYKHYLNNLVYNVEYLDYQKKIKEQLKLSKLLKEININVLKTSLSEKFSPLSSAFNSWRYNLLLKNRDEVLDRIFQNGLFASKHYELLNDQERYKYKNAEFLQTHILNLFIDHYTNDKMIKDISIIINKYGNPL